jgi:hypothetical protein
LYRRGRCPVRGCEEKICHRRGATLPTPLHLSIVADDMDQYVKINFEFQLAICVCCGLGVPKDYLLRHFRDKHKDTWKSHRQELIKFAEGSRSILTDDLEHPTEKREPVEWLKVKDGWTCGWQGCTVSGVDRRWVLTHCRKTHGEAAAESKPWYPSRIQTLLGHPHIK